MADKENEGRLGGGPSQATISYRVGNIDAVLYAHPSITAVRTVPANYPNLSVEARMAIGLTKTQVAAFLPKEGITLFNVSADDKKSDTEWSLQSDEQVVPVFSRNANGDDIVVVTERLIAQFKPQFTLEQISEKLTELNLRILEPLAYVGPLGFLLAANPEADGLGAIRAARRLHESGLVEFAEPDLVEQRSIRSGRTLTPDPATAFYTDKLWHLKLTGVPEAWKLTKGASNIKIAILDDGFDLGHPEFSTEVESGVAKIAAQRDFSTGTDDASSKLMTDNHGTACAGVAAACGIKAPGVAPDCRLVLARIPDFLGSSEEARMFQWAADQGADVISCSWGPIDGVGIVSPLPTSTRLAIRYCLTQGRSGKGIPIFWAAGNGSESVDDDGYAANPDIMAIAASTSLEEHAPYSDSGAAVFACAPSSGDGHTLSIFTTDRRGVQGYNPRLESLGDAEGNYTNRFGGTSAAAPLAAGIAALILSINPSLTAQDVRNILQSTAKKIGIDGSYDTSGHNNQFGFGRLDAAAAVAMAMGMVASIQSAPTITAPPIVQRNGPPPVFQVTPGINPFYVCEFATSFDLFETEQHGSDRTENNFYASWSDMPFQTASTFGLPVMAWEKLRNSNNLFYRIGTSKRNTGYEDYRLSVSDIASSLAPMIAIIDAPSVMTPSSTRSLTRDVEDFQIRYPILSVLGPPRWDRHLGIPVFLTFSSESQSVIFEICDMIETLIDQDSNVPSAIVDSKYWKTEIRPQRSSFGRAQFCCSVTIPIDVWENLSSADRLFYRVSKKAMSSDPSTIYSLSLEGASTGCSHSSKLGDQNWQRYLPCFKYSDPVEVTL